MTQQWPLKAKTADGREVLLLQNMNWEYAEQRQPIAGKRVGQPHFRKAHWGMSQEEVAQTESSTLDRSASDTLSCSTEVAGLPALLGYVFVGCQLVRGVYIFAAAHSNENMYIADFDRLKAGLDKKYEVSQERQIWSDELFRDDVLEWGRAVAAGHLAYICEWETTQTKITLMLRGDNYEVVLSLGYRSKKLGHLEDAAQEASLLEDL